MVTSRAKQTSESNSASHVVKHDNGARLSKQRLPSSSRVKRIPPSGHTTDSKVEFMKLELESKTAFELAKATSFVLPGPIHEFAT
jgi:hypothetical protein